MRSPITAAVLPTLCAGMLVATVEIGFAAEQTSLHTDIERALDANGLTGAVWSIVHTDGTVVIDAAGIKNAQTREPLSANDQVHIGSVAKTLLAAGILRLVSEGRMSLDTPIAEILGELPFDNPWEKHRPLRVRHLLDHTSGLDDARLWQIFSLEANPDTPLAAAFVHDPSVLRVRHPPGARLSYSNMGYGLLGMSIESVTGERYESYLDRHLLAPLGMRDSTFSFVLQQANSRLAMGHFENARAHAAVPVLLRPATQFTTTAHDMALFARYLMSDGRLDGQAFIRGDLLRSMGKPVGTEAARAGLDAGYALGLARRDRHGAIGLCHVGNIVGYWARLCMFPEHQKAFFIAINTDSETADYERFEAMLVNALDLAPASMSKLHHVGPDIIGEWDGIYIPAPNRFATLEWLDTVFNFIRLRWDGTHLNIGSLQSEPKRLLPERGLLFRASDRATASHALITTRDGRRVISDGISSYERAPLWRMVLLWTSLIAGVLGLLYIVLFGAARMLAKRKGRFDPLLIPFAAALAMIVPLLLFSQQSFLQLGQLTLASGVLALVTAMLPLALIAGLIGLLRRRAFDSRAMSDLLAMTALLQLTLVLFAWGLIPLRLWV
jgi:CubicO group peptidase (beta-lactamase class C family)